MSANYLPYDPEQMQLLPEALQDWLPEGHLAYFIGDAVDGLELGAFHARYDKDGPRHQHRGTSRRATYATFRPRLGTATTFELFDCTQLAPCQCTKSGI